MVTIMHFITAANLNNVIQNDSLALFDWFWDDVMKANKDKWNYLIKKRDPSVMQKQSSGGVLQKRCS